MIPRKRNVCVLFLGRVRLIPPRPFGPTRSRPRLMGTPVSMLWTAAFGTPCVVDGTHVLGSHTRARRGHNATPTTHCCRQLLLLDGANALR